MEILVVVFLLVIHVQTQGVTSDIIYSGDGEDLLPTTTYASLIDENGDIENASTLESITVFSTIEKDTLPVLYRNQLSSISTTLEDTTSTVVTVSTPETVHLTNDYFTTTESSTTLTTTETTTVTDLTTTIKSTLREDTTTTYKSTTNTAATTTVTQRTESELEPTKAQQISTEKIAYIPANGEKHCSTVDSNLICEEEIFCYGEGIIDCTEEVKSYPGEKHFMQEISSASASDEFSEYDEYSQYDEVEEGIETFPPYLVGVNSSKKSLKIGTTETSTGNTKINLPSIEEMMNKDSTTLIMNEDSSTLMMNEDSTTLMTNEDSTTLMTNEDSTTLGSLQKSLETIDNLKVMTSSTIFAFDANYTQEEDPKGNNSSLPETTVRMNATEASITSIQTDTREVTTKIVSSTIMEVTSEKPINVRKRREDSLVSSSKLSFDPATVNNSSKMSVKILKVCKLIGNLGCNPSPTNAKCRGKATCQVLSSPQEISEKSSTKGVENWAIAVIAICAVAAALTVSLLVYLIFTSWKKLKVQPQNGVTTLTYVNSTIP